MPTPEVITLGQLTVRFLLKGSQTAGSAAIFEFDVPSRARMPAAHSRDAYEEICYGLKGGVTFTLAGEKIDIGPGQVLCIPRGSVHRFDNNYEADATMLAILSPGILTPQYFREIAATLTPGAVRNRTPPQRAIWSNAYNSKQKSPAES